MKDLTFIAPSAVLSHAIYNNFITFLTFKSYIIFHVFFTWTRGQHLQEFEPGTYICTYRLQAPVDTNESHQGRIPWLIHKLNHIAMLLGTLHGTFKGQIIGTPHPPLPPYTIAQFFYIYIHSLQLFIANHNWAFSEF